jgi:hypothetical protein
MVGFVSDAGFAALAVSGWLLCDRTAHVEKR